MSAFVILSLALAVMAVGVVAVVVLTLLRSVRRLRETVATVRSRVVPLTEELSGELAVTNVEVANLSDAVAQLSKERADRRRRRRGLRIREAPRGRRGGPAAVATRLASRTRPSHRR